MFFCIFGRGELVGVTPKTDNIYLFSYRYRYSSTPMEGVKRGYFVCNTWYLVVLWKICQMFHVDFRRVKCQWLTTKTRDSLERCSTILYSRYRHCAPVCDLCRVPIVDVLLCVLVPICWVGVHIRCPYRYPPLILYRHFVGWVWS